MKFNVTELKRIKRALHAQRDSLLKASRAMLEAHASPGAIDRLNHDFEKNDELIAKVDKMIPPVRD